MERREQILNDWLLMTGQTMNLIDLSRLERMYAKVHEKPLGKKNFERLKNSWLLLTGNMNYSEFKKLKRDYLLLNFLRMDQNAFERLRKYWLLFDGNIDNRNLRMLKKDYLVLNWTKMSSPDHERFRKNWLLLTKRLGIDNQESIIKRWLLNHVPKSDYCYMSRMEKVNYTRFFLERGVDVNAVSRGGNTLLHWVVRNELMMITSLIKLLLIYGADTSHSNVDGLTPLDIVRIYYYKGHEEIVTLLQTAEKFRGDNSVVNDKSTSSSRKRTYSDMQEGNELTGQRRNYGHNNIQKWWIQTNDSAYLNRAGERFLNTDLEDIDNLLMSVINYMFVTKNQGVHLNLNRRVSRNENITKIHQIYGRMCSKLFNLFESLFDELINIEFPATAKLCENAELMLTIEIHPDIKWVALKVFAIPANIEYYILCAAGSKIKFILTQKHMH